MSRRTANIAGLHPRTHKAAATMLTCTSSHVQCEECYCRRSDGAPSSPAGRQRVPRRPLVSTRMTSPPDPQDWQSMVSTLTRWRMYTDYLHLGLRSVLSVPAGCPKAACGSSRRTSLCTSPGFSCATTRANRPPRSNNPPAHDEVLEGITRDFHSNRHAPTTPISRLQGE